MWYKKIRLISLLIVLSGVISCTNSNPFVLKGQVQDPFDNIFNQGKTYIKLEELKSTKGASKILLDHPQYLKKDMLASVLSSIYFKKKSLTGWQKEQNVFQESELLKLTSHIEDAFTRASPSQYILVNSNYTKGKMVLKSDVYTIFGLFISGGKLNVVFSRIQYESITNKGRDKTFKVDSAGTVFVDPFSITKNRFGEINIHTGQRLKKGHDNWVIIDLEKDAFVKKEDIEKKVAPNDKQEESKTNDTGEVISGNHSKGVQPGMSIIREQLLELKELETAGLINDIDYEHKKKDLLEKNDEKKMGKNIKEILAEYLELRNEGFITDEDYEYKKKKLLKNF